MKSVGLFGFGCVGQGFYEIFNHNGISTDSNISKICVRDPLKTRPETGFPYSYLGDDIFTDQGIDTVVELIDCADSAFEIAKRTFSERKHLISANKKMIADNFLELMSLAEKNQSTFRYEASCCGAIPIITTIETYYANENLEMIEGILNGSSNYILTRMASENLSYEDVLKDAQALGFAESDPTLDVQGYDAKYKLTILCVHGFGLILNPKQILNVGIQNIEKQDILFAKERGMKIKQIATLSVKNNQLHAYVMPRFVKESDILYCVDYENNGVALKGEFSDEHFLYGKGAGSYPTGSAVFSDYKFTKANTSYQYSKLKNTHKPLFSNDVEREVYVRFTPDFNKGLLSIFKDRQAINENKNLFIAKANVADLHRFQEELSQQSFICEVISPNA